MPHHNSKYRMHYCDGLEEGGKTLWRYGVNSCGGALAHNVELSVTICHVPT